MESAEFVTVFARLLSDGPLRDAFASDPVQTLAHLAVTPAVQRLLLSLDSRELELQASTLLHKRFESVGRLLPETLNQCGDSAWSLFFDYGRKFWPRSQPPEADDAVRFCAYLKTARPGRVCRFECNRARFILSNIPVAVYFVTGMTVRRRRRFGLQVLSRARRGGWHERFLYFG